MCFVFAVVHAGAQDPDSSVATHPGVASLSLSVGAGIPLGRFAGEHGAGSGFAQTGLQYRADVTAPIYHWLGAQFSVLGGYHATDTKALSADGAGSREVSASGWDYYGVLAGITLRSTHHHPLYLRVQPGAVYVASPRTEIRSSSAAGIITTVQEPKGAWTFATSAGIGVLFRISNFASLTVGAEYMYLSPVFRNAVQSIHSDPVGLRPWETNSVTFRQNMSILSLHTGLAFPL
jgi:hypothetical protein